MSDAPDAELLEQFVRNQSEAAFAELVERHLGLVYSTAFRKTNNPQQAEDITQAVFIILARKADSLGAKTVLPGWLYHTARLTAANLQRSKLRHIRREQEAFMQSAMNESAMDALWRELSPLLEDAMARLGATDRDAIVLRFFQNWSLADVGATLGASEKAVTMRVNRALEKLRKFFNKRGVVSTTAVIAGVISSNSVQAAPDSLANSVTAVAIAKGAGASTATLALAKRASKVMVWSRAKTVVITSAVLLFAAGGTGLISYKIIHAIRAAHYPNIAGTWEGLVHLEEAGVKNGQAAHAHIVLRLFKTKGVYRATADWPEWGEKDVPMVNVVYDYPNLIIHHTVRDTWSLKVNPHATQLFWDRYIHFIQPDPVRFRRTGAPTPVPEPLTESDFTPRPGSALQGYWEGIVGTGPGALPVDVKIARQADGTFRAEFDDPMEGVQGRPIIVSYKPPMIEFKPADGEGMFQGEINDSDTEISGNYTEDGQSITAIFRRGDYQAEHAHDADKDYSFASENDLQGHWKGTWILSFGKVKIPMRLALDIAELPDGSYSATIANLDQVGHDAPIPASDFQFSPPNLHAEWKWAGEAYGSENAIPSYDGKLENGKLIGTWSQGGAGFSLVFERQ